ncbi:MAG: TrkA family potassium uptake protein [Flavobacteriales bacterium]|nr:TrkA family potassium uptake protein [Flavobacteriales bacterium]
MKYIIAGLGSFGASLAERLTIQGNEVIGIDNRMNKVDALKEKISHTICMDATDEYTVAGLPLRDTDVVIIAIGENQGANVMATAIFKNLNVKRLIGRALNPVHEKVLMAIGLDDIIHPEEETAERWAKKLSLKGLVESFDIGDDYSIVEVVLPVEFENKTIEETNLESRYNVMILTCIRAENDASKIKGSSKVQGVAHGKMILQKGDILVMYGANKDLKKFAGKQ